MTMSWDEFQDVLSSEGVDAPTIEEPSITDDMDGDTAALLVAESIGQALARMAWKACRSDVDKLAETVTDVMRRAERAIQRFGALSCDEYAIVAFKLDEIADDLRHDALVLSRVVNAVECSHLDDAEIVHAQAALFGRYAESVFAADEGSEG